MSLISFAFIWLLSIMERLLERINVTICPGLNIITSSNIIGPSSLYKARGVFLKSEFKYQNRANDILILSLQLFMAHLMVLLIPPAFTFHYTMRLLIMLLQRKDNML